MDTDLLGRAQAALQLVGSDPRGALQQADAVLGVIRPRESPEATATAQRAAGLALRELGDLPEAEGRLRAGVRASAGRAPKAQAEARMSLALVLLDRGRTRAALSQADQAAESLSGHEGARLLAQRGLVLQRCGQVSQALEAYARALPILRRFGDEVWEGHVLNNRALLHAYRGSLQQARSDLERVHELAAGPGQQVFEAHTEGNLGFVAALEGDIPEALARYDRSETLFAAEGMPVGRTLLDHGAVLMQAGLLTEARAVTTRAVEDLKRSARDVDVAEGLVALAQVALAEGDAAASADAARRAARLMLNQGRPAWALLARQVRFLAEVSRLPPRTVWRRGVELAAQLRGEGWREEEQDVLLLSSRAAITSGDLRRAGQLLDRAAAVHHARAGAVRHRVWYARALLREARGERSAALRAVVTGLESLDRQRALLGATELRAHVAGQGLELSALGLMLAAEEGRPERILQIAELSRAGALRLRPARPPRDAVLAAALAELRQLASAQQADRMEDASERGGGRATAIMEEKVRRLSRRVPGLSGAVAAAVPATSEILDLLGDRALAEFVVVAEELHLVTGVDGRVRHRELGPVAPVATEVATLRFALQRLTVSTTTRLGAAHDAAADRLQELLLASAPELVGRELVVSPVGVLQGLAWPSLPGLRDVAVSVTPSATLWCRAASAANEPSVGGVAIAAGPDLPAAIEEVKASALYWPNVEVLTDDEATVGATLRVLEGASIAHIAAHARLRTDNPLFSSLEMADGPLTVYDLERLDRVPPVVMLPACRSAVSAVRSGDELLGLASAFLALGTRAVIASVIPVPDGLTAAFMPRLHAQLARGLAPAHALSAAIGETQGAAERATASSFLCLGCG